MRSAATDRLYLMPRALSEGHEARDAVAAETAVWLAGGPVAFSQVALTRRLAGGEATATHYDLPGIRAWLESSACDDRTSRLWSRLTGSRDVFAGLDPTAGPILMGIVNVTPDSFSDGGDLATAAAAIAHGLTLAQAGAHLIDVGGESTRPGADPVSPEEELRRVIPVVAGLAERGLRISIDTRRAAVMTAAVAAGATVINDVNALGDPAAMTAAADSGADIILMHMHGEPKTMQVAPRYADVLLDVYDFLEARIEACDSAGIDPGRLCIDPGIGFGKTGGHNFTVISGLALFHGLGCPVLLGASRKSFIAGTSTPKARLGGSLAAALAGHQRGAQILRVHDVAQTRQALAINAAITLAGR